MTADDLRKVLAAAAAAKWTDVGLLLVALAGLLAAAGAAFIVFRQWRGEHERLLRKAAVDLCMDWTRSLDPAIFAVTNLLELLDGEACRRIEKLDRVVFDSKKMQLIRNIFNDDIAGDGDKIVIDGHRVLFIRQSAMKYLDLMESVLTAWQQGVADRGIIEKLFTPLFQKTKGATGLKMFRNAVGTAFFPAIALFEQTIGANAVALA